MLNNEFGSIKAMIINGTEQLFTDAVNASFYPVSRYGVVPTLELYQTLEERLPIDEASSQHEERLKRIDPAAITALNALGALVAARRERLHIIMPDATALRNAYDQLAVFTAPVEVIEAIVKAQKFLSKDTLGRYIDTSFTGVAPNPLQK